jgi:hypothetical protein
VTKGLIFALGDPFGDTVTLSSASNAGLSDPGQLVCIHLTLGTEALLRARSTEDNPPWSEQWITLMESITELAQETFVRIDEEIEAEEHTRRAGTDQAP